MGLKAKYGQFHVCVKFDEFRGKKVLEKYVTIYP